MFDELNDLIKSDTLSQEKFASFKIRLKNSQDKDQKAALKRARLTALILGLASTISIIFLLYAHTQSTIAEKAMVKVEYLEKQLEECPS